MASLSNLVVVGILRGILNGTNFPQREKDFIAGVARDDEKKE